jgi:23S rRNA pseudouridine2605 synthase
MSNSEKPTSRVRTRKTIDKPADDNARPKIVYKSKSEPRTPRRESFGDDKPRRNFGGDERPRRSFDGDRGGDRSRAPRRESFGDDKPRRNFGGDERPRRSFDGDRGGDRSRAPRRENFGDDKPRRNFGGDERPRRSFDGDRGGDRPRAPRRESFGDDKPRRNFGGDERPRRSFDGDRGGDRPRVPRRENFGDDKPRRSFGGDDKPRRSFDSDRGGDRPRAPRRESFGDDKPRRSFGGDERPRRSFDSDRGGDRSRAPRRENFGDDKPRRSFGGDYKPRRNFDNENRGERDAKPRANRSNEGGSKDDMLKKYEQLTGGRSAQPRFENSFGAKRKSEDNNRRRPNDTGFDFAPAKRAPKVIKEKGNFFTKNFGDDQPVSKKDKNKDADDAYFERVAAHLRKKEEQQAKYEKEFEREEMQGDEQMPLNKYLSHSGVSGRREAADIVKSGRVQVNDKVQTEPGYKVLATDKVKLDGKVISPEVQLVYLLVNKPKDYITTTDDEKDRKTILDLVEGATDQRVYPIGRLDRNTSGLIILTNDGELTQKLSHPKFKVKKLYQVNLDKPLTKEHFKEIFNGIELEDGITEVDDLAYADADDLSKIGIQIHSGKNRVVRRIFETLGYEVKQLDRVMYANLTKKNIPRGKYRFLTPAEVRHLKSSKG